MKVIPNYPKYMITADGKVWSNYTKKYLLPIRVDNGYHFVTLCQNKEKHVKTIHRLVLETYVGPCPKGMEGCHNNGIKTDNRLKNLRWDTRYNNQQDKIKHGNSVKVSKGEAHYCSKLKEQEVRTIIYMWRTKLFTQKEIAKIYNIDCSSISNIMNKKTWKHIWRN